MSGRIESEQDLRHWLAEEDWYMSSHTRQWLERTPPAQAADLLDRIAAGADLEPPVSVRAGLMTILNAFSVSGELGSEASRARKAGIRAALMLANLDDVRAIDPLARVFETSPQRQSRYQELIERALLRVLASTAGRPDASECAPRVQDLVARVWQGSDRSDLTKASADVLVAALRYLQTTGVETGLAVLRSIAEAQVAKPNRARVREAARSLLNA